MIVYDMCNGSCGYLDHLRVRVVRLDYREGIETFSSKARRKLRKISK